MIRKRKNKKDVWYILNNLRQEDIEECRAVHGSNWKKKSYKEIMKTNFVIFADENNIPVCMGGAWYTKDSDKSIGVLWLLSTNDVVNHKIGLLRLFKKEFQEFDKKYRFLYNIIYEKNFIAKSWLKGLGCKFDLPKPAGMKIPDRFEFFYRIRQLKKGLLD